MRGFELYAILDRELAGKRSLVDIAKEFIKGGVDLIQYRDKISCETEILENSKILAKLKFPLIINDYPEIAREVNALGVHLGQNDLDSVTAKRIIGHGKILGRSASNLEEALIAEKQGADYIGIGPAFSTSTKKNAVPINFKILRDVAENIRIPVFAIGGITLYNINIILSSGINRVAVSGALINAENIEETTKMFRKKLHYESSSS